ncbi:MAG: hypothetical protein GQ574_21120 [Crocinitomix sp.]|nr:hypothetical protein [Crocinitomix sp.]
MACGKNTVEKSVYHWETEFDLTAEEEAFLEKEEIQTVYTKFFDITLDSEMRAMPVAKVNFLTAPQQEIVPVVYIITDVFKALDSNAIQNLVANVYEQLQTLNPQDDFSEIQIDCDWMASIKDKYFYFLTELKSKIGETMLSCTIRLYQYKYPNLAGVPPVDKGVLMYYNMGELLSYSETNSILNNEIGEQYLGFGEYPIPLDFALPNFSWTLLYQYGEMKRILLSIDAHDLNDTTLFQQQASGYYLVKKDTLLDGVFLRSGSELRHETCSENELIRAANLLSPEKNQNHTTLLFYDLKPNLVNESDKINRVFAAFK